MKNSRQEKDGGFKLKLKLNIYSFKFNIWFYFVFFVLIIITLTLILQVIALRPLDSTIKPILAKALSAPIVDVCKKENYLDLLQDLEVEDDLQFAVFIARDISSSPIYSNAGSFYLNLLPEYQINISEMDVNSELSRLYDDGTTHYAVYGKKVVSTDSNDVQTELIIFSVLPAGEFTSAKSLIIWVSIVISCVDVVLAIIFAYFISKRFTNPLNEIVDKAKKLAKGDYDISFERNSFTEIDRLANTLSLTAQRLSETDNLKNELLANISHDLKTPLTLIKSYAEMIKELSGNNPEKRGEHLDVIISEADRLAVLVNDLVLLSRIQAASDEIKLSDFSLSDAVKHMVDNYKCVMDYNFQTEITPDIQVFADYDKILQVVANILNNAINYTGDDKTVKIKVFAVNSLRARVEITDTGKGIPEEEMDKIWDRYYRSNRTHYREVSGSGLGLSIVKSILNNHHTEYGVVSELNKGSTFFFILPRSSKASKQSVEQKLHK